MFSALGITDLSFEGSCKTSEETSAHVRRLLNSHQRLEPTGGMYAKTWTLPEISLAAFSASVAPKALLTKPQTFPTIGALKAPTKGVFEKWSMWPKARIHAGLRGVLEKNPPNRKFGGFFWFAKRTLRQCLYMTGRKPFATCQETSWSSWMNAACACHTKSKTWSPCQTRRPKQRANPILLNDSAIPLRRFWWSVGLCSSASSLIV